MTTLTEARYEELADLALREVEDLFTDVDAEDVDFERSGDVLTMTFRDRKRCVLNTQRAARQIWLAADARAWHFDWEETEKRWLDARHPSPSGAATSELFGVLRAILSAHGLEM